MRTVRRHATCTSQARACDSTHLRRHASCATQHERAAPLTRARTHVHNVQCACARGAPLPTWRRAH
eukprot:8362779-Alexandrium_andersonii.AAC.1